MTSPLFFILIEISIIACGVVAGVFLTFSDFVMTSLAASQPAGGIQSMQIINRKVFRSVFMGLLLGMSALSPFLIAYAYFDMDGPVSALIISGGMLYLVGVFGVSLIYNVPMNQKLDAMDYSDSDAFAYWTDSYVPRWSFWNYIRALSSAGAAICYLIASLQMTQAM